MSGTGRWSLYTIEITGFQFYPKGQEFVFLTFYEFIDFDFFAHYFFLSNSSNFDARKDLKRNRLRHLAFKYTVSLLHEYLIYPI